MNRKRLLLQPDSSSYSTTTKRLAICDQPQQQQQQLASAAAAHGHHLLAAAAAAAAAAAYGLPPLTKFARMAAPQVLHTDHQFHHEPPPPSASAVVAATVSVPPPPIPQQSVPPPPPHPTAGQTMIVVGGGGGGGHQNGNSNGKSIQNGSVSNFEVTAGTQQQPNSVLRVIIENMVFPVSLDVLHQLFARFGKVLRIITFNKNNTFQALIQMSEAQSAQTSKQNLDNQNVYNGCCTLRIDYSKLSTLNVKYNNDKSRDYTNPNLPAGEISLDQQLLGLSGLQNLMPTASPYNYAFGANPATTFLQPQLAAAATAAAAAAAANDSALAQYLPAAAMGLTTNNPLSPALSALRFPVNMMSITPVILVSNLNDTKVTTDALFTLFGVYGDVTRVKILYNKKDNALIQYAEPQQAQLALTHLDKVKWHDRVIRVAPSKHTNVQMPKEGQPDAGLTRDYTHSTLHRFKKPGSKNYMNIYPPCSTLHLSNIPNNVTEEKLKEAFKETGYNVKAFKFFPKDHKMALCQLEDIETAIDALIKMHNFKLAENAHLRVSFSKSGI